MTRADLPAFATSVGALGSEADYRALVARFGVDRVNPGFWPYSDTLASVYARLEPVASGVLDYGRFENR
ncbi:MAG: fatty acid cis/trans isomerase [Gammaproteobacteria bacterium]